MTAMSVSNHQNQIFALGAIGLATGLVTMLIQPFDGMLLVLFEARLVVLEQFFGDVLLGIGLVLAPGLIFGAAIAWRVARTMPGGIWRRLGFIAFATGSWYAGVRAALATDPDNQIAGELAVAGLAGGFVGAAVIAAGAAICYPFARQLMPALVLVSLGAIAGLLLAVEIGEDSVEAFLETPGAAHLLFPVWQTLVAGALGWAVQRTMARDRIVGARADQGSSIDIASSV